MLTKGIENSIFYKVTVSRKHKLHNKNIRQSINITHKGEISGVEKYIPIPIRIYTRNEK